MIVLPAIERELRAQARLGSTYTLRVLGASVLLAASVYFVMNTRQLPDQGGQLFGLLNGSLFLSIWFFVPLLAADCISCERREGTLGLLFMTPLKSRDIVLAKSFVHGLRALTLLLAVIPVMAIPFLMGGVGWREAVWSALVNFSSLGGALAAGLLASSLSKRWLRAQIFACLLGVSFAVVFVYVAGCLTIHTSMPGPTLRLRPYAPPSYSPVVNRDMIVLAGFRATTDFGGVWGPMFAAMSKLGKSSWLVTGACLPLLSLLFLLISIELAAGRLRRVWQEEPPSGPRLWLEQKLVTPIVGVAFLHRWMRRKLERNPIGWLEQRTWSGRLVTWSWFAVMVSLYSAGLGGQYASRVVNNLQTLMGWLLLLGIASSASGSFQRERETGVMELLLVSPMTEGQIIGGRIRGLFGQFLPAAALFIGVWIYFHQAMPEWGNPVEMQFFCGACLILPVIGLYYSLRRKNFITAFLSTVFMGLLLPVIIGGVFSFLLPLLLMDGFGSALYQFDNSPGGAFAGGPAAALRQLAASPGFLTVLQLAVAVRCARRLYHDLKRRNFPFSRAVN
jgi:ABC-type transport system involved in multi-copper enzyme maturation permease subunit